MSIVNDTLDAFEVHRPGVFSAREAAPVAALFAEAAAIDARGPIDVAALVAGSLPADTPGLGPVLPVTREMVQYCNAKYDPDNALLTDPEVAREYGFDDIQPFGTFGAHDDTFSTPFPVAARDKLLVSQLNHRIEIHAPVHPGDTLYLVTDRKDIIERTPVAGSPSRTVSVQTHGSVYNQHGEKVNSVIFRITESVRTYREDPNRTPEQDAENAGFSDVWDAPDWLTRPAHTYTDADWDRIVAIWQGEQPRGHAPLFWEDVAVGDHPNPTADGPIDVTVQPAAPYGMGTGGSRTLKREILDSATRATMQRGEDGILRLPDERAHIPAVPDGAISPVAAQFDPGAIDTRDIHAEGADRSVIVNFMARDIAIRHVTNWMGYHGRLAAIEWSIMPPSAMAAYGKPVPTERTAPRHAAAIGDLAGRDVEVHGLTKDLALVQSVVLDTYLRGGVGVVELGWWIETIDGEIWTVGAATVELPTRGA